MAARRNFSTFAQEQLEKHGWKDGQGLGRTESGISEAIKVKIKHDTAGVGHDLGEQFTYHWWDHVFNKAASNIVVEKGQDGVKLSRKETKYTGPISNKKSLKNKGRKPLLYGNFVKSATLSTEGLQRDGCNDSSSSSSEDEDGEGMNIDDKFFKACGGRTAHKGARHGLNLSGKLKRIQAQEDNGHLPRPTKDNITEIPNPPLRDSDKVLSVKESKKDRKHKKKQQREKEQIIAERTVESSHLEPVSSVEISDIANDDRKGYDYISTSDITKRKKNKKNKRKKVIENGDSNTHEYSADDINDEEGDTKRERTTEISHEYAAVDVTKEKKKKHKRKRTKDNGDVHHEYSTDNLEFIDVTKEKKRKDKRKRIKNNGDVHHEYSTDNRELIDVTKEKKRKDKRKRTKDNGDVHHEYSADN